MLSEITPSSFALAVITDDISELVKVFNEAKKIKKCVLVHVITKKGKGYEIAERHPARFHGAEPFEIETGLPKKKKEKTKVTSKEKIAILEEKVTKALEEARDDAPRGEASNKEGE